MKKTLFLFLILLSLNHLSFSQKLVQPSEGKSIVYFIPTYIEYEGINEYKMVTGEGKIEWIETKQHFILFDDETYLGKYDGYDNIYYECEPGTHLFWNGDLLINYIQAELLANKVYVVYMPIEYSRFNLFKSLKHDFTYPNDYNLFPIAKKLDSCEFEGFSDYLILRIKDKKHISISEILSLNNGKEKVVNELKRKSEILYDYKLRTKEPIPVLLPEMYIEIPEKIFTE